MVISRCLVLVIECSMVWWLSGMMVCRLIILILMFLVVSCLVVSSDFCIICESVMMVMLWFLCVMWVCLKGIV